MTYKKNTSHFFSKELLFTMLVYLGWFLLIPGFPGLQAGLIFSAYEFTLSHTPGFSFLNQTGTPDLDLLMQNINSSIFYLIFFMVSLLIFAALLVGISLLLHVLIYNRLIHHKWSVSGFWAAFRTACIFMLFAVTLGIAYPLFELVAKTVFTIPYAGFILAPIVMAIYAGLFLLPFFLLMQHAIKTKKMSSAYAEVFSGKHFVRYVSVYAAICVLFALCFMGVSAIATLSPAVAMYTSMVVLIFMLAALKNGLFIASEQ